jgi:hypothetical protein
MEQEENYHYNLAILTFYIQYELLRSACPSNFLLCSSSSFYYGDARMINRAPLYKRKKLYEKFFTGFSLQHVCIFFQNNKKKN